MNYYEKIKNIEKMFGNKINDKNKTYFYIFWEKVDIKENINECWNWIGCINTNRYGRFSDSMTLEVLSHRLAYIMSKGNIPYGLQVQHLCNNPTCCNPNHLILGNQSKNMRYKSVCERCNISRESDYHSHSLTGDQVRQIHRLYIEQRKLHPDIKQWRITEPIAQRFEIHKSTVQRIIKGEHWQYIYEEFHRKR